MLNERHRARLLKSEDLIRTGEPVYVMVGAMYLNGPGSVVELLRQMGYRVEPQ